MPTILIVEDEAKMRRLLELNLGDDGFTTFSAFSLQTLELLRAGEAGRAGAYVAGSVLACVLAVWAGFAMGGR